MTQAAEPQQTAPPQYSPDGQWWWTGNEWVPAAQVAPPPTYPAPATSAAPATYPPPANVAAPAPAVHAAPAPRYIGFSTPAKRTSFFAVTPRGMALLGGLLVLIFVLGIAGRVLSNSGVGQGRAAQRQEQLKADLRNAATLEETYYTTNQTYLLSMNDLIANGLSVTPGDDLEMVSANSQAYCISATRPGVATVYYDSDGGGIVSTPCS